MKSFQEIHQKAVQAAQRFKKAEADLISVLQEIESSKTFFKLGYTSLFQYVVQSLQLSESVASNFITVSRKAKEFSALQAAIDEGKITVSKARKVTAVLTPENQKEWVDKAVELPQKKLEEQVAIVAPETKALNGVKPIAENLSQLKVGISKELEEKLKRVQDLESQRTRRAVKLSETLEALVDLYLEKKDPVKKAERVLKRDADACVARHVTQVSQSDTGQIPAKTKHQVTLRDGRQCTHTENGKRCEARRWLDVHHIILRSQGGTNALENLATLCSAHHRMEHKVA
jgi:5-methylcytosine-specific restriction endonuclease McrA